MANPKNKQPVPEIVGSTVGDVDSTVRCIVHDLILICGIFALCIVSLVSFYKGYSVSKEAEVIISNVKMKVENQAIGGNKKEFDNYLSISVEGGDYTLELNKDRDLVSYRLDAIDPYLCGSIVTIQSRVIRWNITKSVNASDLMLRCQKSGIVDIYISS